MTNTQHERPGRAGRGKKSPPKDVSPGHRPVRPTTDWRGATRAGPLDGHANLNSSVIDDYRHSGTPLPRAGGAPEIAIGGEEGIVIAPHSRRAIES